MAPCDVSLSLGAVAELSFEDLISNRIDMGRRGLPAERGGKSMMGQREFQSKLYYQLSLDRLVPGDHLLRHIAEGVDFSFVRPLCRPYYSHTGQPSVDPVVIFKMLLIGYLYGITSERRLAVVPTKVVNR
jgi:hypothetical protein